MRRLALVAGLAASAALAACSPAVPSRDKAWYAAHEAERTSQIAACQNNPGGLGKTPNCVNAQAADADVHTQHVYDTAKPAARVQDPGKL
jgi:hypothetical protein